LVSLLLPSSLTDGSENCYQVSISAVFTPFWLHLSPFRALGQDSSINLTLKTGGMLDFCPPFASQTAIQPPFTPSAGEYASASALEIRLRLPFGPCLPPVGPLRGLWRAQ